MGATSDQLFFVTSYRYVIKFPTKASRQPLSSVTVVRFFLTSTLSSTIGTRLSPLYLFVLTITV
jgi:hypothetical protein